jgi:hypothetical protein
VNPLGKATLLSGTQLRENLPRIGEVGFAQVVGSRWRPIEATIPFVYIGKEIERRAQEGEDISLAEDTRPRTYAPRQTRHTRPASADLIRRAGSFSIRKLMRESGASQHSVERFLDHAPVHPATRAQLEDAVEKLERKRGVQNL